MSSRNLVSHRSAARTNRHRLLQRLADRLGTISKLASQIKCNKQSVYSWVWLQSYPSETWWDNHPETAARLERLANRTYEEIWPYRLRRRILRMSGKRDRLAERFATAGIVYQELRNSCQKNALMSLTPGGIHPDLEKLDLLMSALPERNARIVELCLIREMSLEEASAQLQVTRERARQLVCRSIQFMQQDAEDR